MQAAVSELDDGGQTPVPWRLSRSVIDSVGLAGAEFALPNRGRGSMLRLWFARPRCGAQGSGLRETVETPGKAALVLLIFLSRSR